MQKYFTLKVFNVQSKKWQIARLVYHTGSELDVVKKSKEDGTRKTAVNLGSLDVWWQDKVAGKKETKYIYRHLQM